MARLADAIDELEENLYAAEARIHELEEDAARKDDEISDLEDQGAEMQDYIDWIDETYPEARIAYEAKQRLDEAA